MIHQAFVLLQEQCPCRQIMHLRKVFGRNASDLDLLELARSSHEADPTQEHEHLLLVALVSLP